MKTTSLNGYNAGWVDASEGRIQNNPFDESPEQKSAHDAYDRGYQDVASFRRTHGTDKTKPSEPNL